MVPRSMLRWEMHSTSGLRNFWGRLGIGLTSLRFFNTMGFGVRTPPGGRGVGPDLTDIRVISRKFTDISEKGKSLRI